MDALRDDLGNGWNLRYLNILLLEYMEENSFNKQIQNSTV